MVRTKGFEPPQSSDHKNLNLARLPIPPRPHGKIRRRIGGGTRIRTGDQGFADPCLTTWPCRHGMKSETAVYDKGIIIGKENSI